MTSKIIPVSDLRRKVSQTIKELQHSAHDEAVYITQHGRPQAVLVSYEHYEQLREQARHRMLPADIEVIRNDPELIALVERIKATPQSSGCSPRYCLAVRVIAKRTRRPGF